MTSNTSGTTPRIKIAICGEVSSGKTSFINSLRRGDALPDFSSTKIKPLVRVVFGAESDAIFLVAGDTKQPAKAFKDVPTNGIVTELEVHTTSNVLGICEVIEFPSLRDGHVTPGEIEAIGACDILVWMTIGSQAWRLSEKTIIDKIPNRHAERSVLVVSRADKFRSNADQDRLAARLEEETSAYFESGAMLCADPKTLVQAKDDDAAWDKVGGKAHSELLALLVKKVEATKPMPKIEAPLPKVEASEPTKIVRTSQIKRPRRTKKRGTSRPISKAIEPQSVATEAEAPAQKEATRVAAKELATPVEVEEVAAPLEEKAVVEAPINAESQLDEMKTIAEGLDGLIALTSFKTNAPEEATVICGDATRAKEFAKNLAEGANFLVKDSFFDDPEWVHIAAHNHQILYRIDAEKNETLLLACRSSNPGMARNALMRISSL